ncbi:hypothetical protein VYA_16570 [Vibrio alfacsensis]|nr:hypothetical protein VYA_16570 [Vibrio alfacsensis]
MVPTLLVRRRAWNLSMAVANVDTYFGDPHLLHESGCTFTEKYQFYHGGWFGA